MLDNPFIESICSLGNFGAQLQVQDTFLVEPTPPLLTCAKDGMNVRTRLGLLGRVDGETRQTSKSGMNRLPMILPVSNPT